MWGRGQGGREAGRQADRGEGVRKDKAREENVAGFKGCRLAWPRRSHEVYGCMVCWVLWNRLAVGSRCVFLAYLVQPQTVFQECREKQTRTRVAWPILSKSMFRPLRHTSQCREMQSQVRLRLGNSLCKTAECLLFI